MRKRTILAILLVLLVVGFIWYDQDHPEPADPEATESYHIPTDWRIPDQGGSYFNGKNIVKTVLSYEGEIPYTWPVREFVYELPYIDLSGRHALGCNQEIEQRYGTLIRESVEAMQFEEAPVLEKLTYQSFILGGVLTLKIDRRDLDGSSSTAYYTCDAQTGDAVTPEALFAAAGINGVPETVLDEAVRASFAARYGPAEGAGAPYTTALFLTLDALEPLTAKRMHLTEAGKLAVALELYAPGGGANVVELTLPAEN